MRSSRLRVIVGGELAGAPDQGGASWAVLQYVIGLRDLGHDVLVVDPVSPGALADPSVRRSFAAIVDEFDLSGRAVLLGRDTHRTIGLEFGQIVAFAQEADLLLNLSGLVADEMVLGAVALRVYVDLDPAFTQLWNDACGIDMRLASHDRHVTVGLGIGSPECTVPTCGVDWITTTPPVVCERWPTARALEHNAFTTVANWRGYGSIEHNGVLYGQKAHSLRRLMELPDRTREQFVLALAIDPGEPDDLTALRTHGWRLITRESFPRTPSEYQRFVRGSKAEIGVAKSGYVVSRCGWFSDRSACYLASGRPVLAQDTGFSSFLPCGDGLLAFNDIDDAVARIEALTSSYDAHRRAARDFAETHLRSSIVLPALIEAVGSNRCATV
jgi:hypothetical protein